MVINFWDLMLFFMGINISVHLISFTFQLSIHLDLIFHRDRRTLPEEILIEIILLMEIPIVMAQMQLLSLTIYSGNIHSI